MPPLLALAALLLGACVRPVAEPAPLAGPAGAEIESESETPALTVARLLAMAERAAAAPAPAEAGLAAVLGALDAQGARPAVPGEDPVGRWRALLPAGAVTPMRGRLLGPAYRRGMLDAGASIALDQLFDGGRQARVAVASARGAALGIAVLDGAGRSVCAPAAGAQGQCAWVPPFSTRHRIVLNNPGPESSAYYLVID
jgi:hypothetical protein